MMIQAEPCSYQTVTLTMDEADNHLLRLHCFKKNILRASVLHWLTSVVLLKIYVGSDNQLVDINMTSQSVEVTSVTPNEWQKDESRRSPGILRNHKYFKFEVAVVIDC